MRDDLRQWTAGYVVGAVALTLWASTAQTHLAVFALFVAGSVVGATAWTLVAERRVPWPFGRGVQRDKPAPGSALVAFLASFIALLGNEIARSNWPPRGDLYLGQPIVTTSPDGGVVTQTVIQEYDIPVHAAMGVVVFVGLFLSVLAIGSAIVTGVDLQRRRRRAIRTVDELTAEP